MAAVDDDLVFHATGIRQSRHLGRIAARHHRRRLQHQRTGRTGRHHTRLRPGVAGQHLAGPVIEFIHVD